MTQYLVNEQCLVLHQLIDFIKGPSRLVPEATGATTILIILVTPAITRLGLFQVPILLILAGSIALQRPTPEVAEPLVVTNVYIVLDARTMILFKRSP